MSDETMRADTLPVPGANLYFTSRGSGPLLLLLQGGDGDADGMAGLSRHLSAHYTVVAYDRRGLSRSKLDDLAEIPRLETHSDDVHRLIASLTAEPVLVFGASIGAVIGLDLVARHPGQIGRFVAFEPPAGALLPQAERAAADQAHAQIIEAFLREGPAAMRLFADLAGMDPGDREPDVELPPMSPGRLPNLTFFMTRDAPTVARYSPDVTALKMARRRIVVGVGRSTRGRFPHRCAEALAELLGTSAVEFPGDHAGFTFRPREFAAKLHETLA